jgi:hypothetical protein
MLACVPWCTGVMSRRAPRAGMAQMQTPARCLLRMLPGRRQRSRSSAPSSLLLQPVQMRPQVLALCSCVQGNLRHGGMMHSIPLSRICTGVAATLLAMVCLQTRQRMAGPTQMSRGKIVTGTKASVCSLTMHLDAVPQVMNKVMHQSPVPADYANCAHLLLARSPAQRSRDRDKERGRKRDRSRSRSRERHHSKSSRRQDDHRHRQSSSRHRSDRERGSQEGSPDRRRDRSPQRGHGQPSGREASDSAGEPASVPTATPKREAVFEVSKNGGKEVGPSRRGHPRTGLSAWRCPGSVVPPVAMPGAGCF